MPPWPSFLRAVRARPAESAALVLLVLGALVLAFVVWRQAPPEPPAVEAFAVEAQAGGDVLVVHVAGQVVTPGIVSVPVGARVVDALAAAGGALPDAVLDRLNLARLVEDGERIHVPAPGEEPAGSAGGRVDLNRATAAELERLPGVGPVLAGRIIEFREAQGGFRRIEDLRQVRGIGAKLYAELAELLEV